MSDVQERDEHGLAAEPIGDAEAIRRGGPTVTRRGFLQTAVAVAGVVGAPQVHGQARTGTAAAGSAIAPSAAPRPVRLAVNGQTYTLQIEPRVTLLDALRETIGLAGTKKGCDRGQCGACTVIVDGRRINACLTLAVMNEGKQITTVEGLASGDPANPRLAPLQAAFIEYDAFQCGFCTPGQLCSATAVLREIKEGRVSAATPDVRATRVAFSDAEIRERMSGNICRCGAYQNIVRAMRSVAAESTATAGTDRVLAAARG